MCFPFIKIPVSVALCFISREIFVFSSFPPSFSAFLSSFFPSWSPYTLPPLMPPSPRASLPSLVSPRRGAARLPCCRSNLTLPPLFGQVPGTSLAKSPPWKLRFSNFLPICRRPRRRAPLPPCSIWWLAPPWPRGRKYEAQRRRSLVRGHRRADAAGATVALLGASTTYLFIAADERHDGGP